MNTLRLATRESPLALWQSEFVAAQLRAAHPQLQVELVPMTTRGDQVLDQPLAQIGGKGLFLKELEVAMLEGRADAAVHSLKDMPNELEGPFRIAAVLERHDPCDAFVSNHFPAFDELPYGARVGTSSLRRQALLKAQRPDLTLVDLRGNVGTRLGKLDAGDYDAIILACAGLERLGMKERIRERLTPPRFVPAVAQGAIAVECRDDATEVAALLAVLEHEPTRLCVRAERRLNHLLGGSCHVPIAAYAHITHGKLQLEALVGDVREGRSVRALASGALHEPEKLGETVADMLFRRGADALLEAH